MSRFSWSGVLSGVAIVILIAALPNAILRTIRTGNLYLFTDQFFQDILARLSGPGRMRFIIQPVVAIALGIRSGMKDGDSGVPPFLWALVFHREHRRELLRSTFASIRNLVAMAILADLLSQFLIFHQIRPGAALVLGPVLIATPYALSRALSNRVSQWRHHDKPADHASCRSRKTDIISYPSHRILLALVVVSAVISTPGKSTKLVIGWKNPTYVAGKKFGRILALGLSDKTVIRADFEDALAAQFAQPGIETIPGHSILLRPEDTDLDLNYLKTQIREHNVDAVVVSRLISVENTETYVPGVPYVPPYPYYNTFYGYYSAVYPIVYTPGYLKKEKKVRIETSFYAISSDEGELAWTCITDTFNPSNIKKAIDSLVKIVVKQMQSDGVM
jgi:hypothetical protein